MYGVRVQFPLMKPRTSDSTWRSRYELEHKDFEINKQIHSRLRFPWCFGGFKAFKAFSQKAVCNTCEKVHLTKQHVFLNVTE